MHRLGSAVRHLYPVVATVAINRLTRDVIETLDGYTLDGRNIRRILVTRRSTVPEGSFTGWEDTRWDLKAKSQSVLFTWRVKAQETIQRAGLYAMPKNRHYKQDRSVVSQSVSKVRIAIRLTVIAVWDDLTTVTWQKDSVFGRLLLAQRRQTSCITLNEVAVIKHASKQQVSVCGIIS